MHKHRTAHRTGFPNSGEFEMPKFAVFQEPCAGSASERASPERRRKLAKLRHDRVPVSLKNLL